MANRHSARASRTRDAAHAENRRAEQERQAQRQQHGAGDESQTFTTTFTFDDGTTRTQGFHTEEEQQAAQTFFNEGRRRGAW